MYIINDKELKVFRLLDEHLYLVKENPGINKILDTLNGRYSEKDIQRFIDRVVSWYSVKYSDKFLNSLFDDSRDTDVAILQIMNFDTLTKNFNSFEHELFQKSNDNNAKVILQKKLIVMVGWGLIYNKNSTPEYGYYRAKQLFKDFNSIYSWKLSPSIYKSIFERDYSPSNEENIRLIEKKTAKKHHDKKKKKRIISLFRK